MEVAILLPPIILWIVWLVFFMIFIMDLSVVKSEVIRVSNETAMIWDKDGDPVTGEYKLPSRKSLLGLVFRSDQSGKLEGKALSRLKKRLKDRLILSSPSDVDVHIGSLNVTARGSVRFRWPFSAFRDGGIGGLSFSGKAVSPVNNWEEVLRMAKAMEKSKD